MKIKIIFDKHAVNKSLFTGWGVSFLVNNEILFDTGENGDWLINNIKKLKINMDKLKIVVISHDHWDHSRGLWELLRQRKGVTVYACPGFSEDFKRYVRMVRAKLIENSDFTQIRKNIYVTGEISAKYEGSNMSEQALVLKTTNGINVLTGCAHPGIIKILKKVRKKFPREKLYLVLGGFHLQDKSPQAIKTIVDGFIEIGVKKVGPTHCTGKKAEEIFKSRYRKDFVSVKVGQIIEA